MPRRAREKSESGIYHIILRGANRQEIFHDDEDHMKFLETIFKYKCKAEAEVYGWCLMSNHVHFLLKEGEEELSITMKRIGVSYAWYYNWKYNTTGHLFQDRYLSENINSEEYLLTAVRYIHQNPVKAGLVSNAANWNWSSYQGYLGKYIYPQGLLNKELVLGIFSKDPMAAITRFKIFNEEINNVKHLDDHVKRRLTDHEAKEEILKVITSDEIIHMKSLAKQERDKLLGKIRRIEGLTQRQAARILGISPNLIFKS
ncbi:MAG: transposase [Bacillota bacterium]|nr:transposase [Bacillota bacterium]